MHTQHVQHYNVVEQYIFSAIDSVWFPYTHTHTHTPMFSLSIIISYARGTSAH